MFCCNLNFVTFAIMVEWIVAYFLEFYRLLLEMAPWLLLGFTFAGLLHVFMPGGSIRKYMGGRNLKSVVYAALLGVPLPLCSCGVIPTGISFHKEGASKGATVSFLISTPQTGVDSILATYSMLGLPFALLRPFVAFFSGIFGGVITNLASKDEEIKAVEPPIIKSEEIEKGGKLRKMVKYAFLDFLMDIADWLIIGFAIAALISVLLPDDFFTMYLRNQFLSMLIVSGSFYPSLCLRHRFHPHCRRADDERPFARCSFGFPDGWSGYQCRYDDRDWKSHGTKDTDHLPCFYQCERYVFWLDHQPVSSC